MTDNPATPPANEPPKDDETKLRTVVADVLGSLLGSGKAAVADDGKQTATPARKREEDVSETVKKAIRDVNSERDREDRVTSLAKDVSDLKAASQKPPKTIRKIERFMGWHGDDE